MKTVVLIFMTVVITAPSAWPQELCGDVNLDGSVNVADITAAVNYLFRGIPAQPYYRPADVNGRFGVTVSDLTWFVAYLFRGGPALTCPVGVAPQMGEGCLGSWLSNPNRSAAKVQTVSTGCLTPVPADSTESMFVELIGRDLHVHHLNAYYQCCLGYIASFAVEGYMVTVQEADTADPCYCLCYFNLEAVLPDFDTSTPAEYTVTLIGISGDTVGVDTLLVGGPSSMSVEVIGNDLRVHHLNAEANCCPFFISDIFITGSDITVVEWDTLSICDCICTYNLMTEINDLEPGEYEVTLIGVCTYPWLCDVVGVDTVMVAGRSEE